MYDGLGKRVLDIGIAALLLVGVAPLLLATAVAVRIALGPGVLFRQSRAGWHGRPFVLVKFRSMRAGTGTDDSRLTRFGRWLRASGLDELPQLLNVLRGEMSLVGPRPLPVAYVALYSPRERLRLLARPGIAGLAQAAGRNAVPWAERLELDAAYASQRARLETDLAIIARSLAAVLRGAGATAPGHATMPPFTGTPPATGPDGIGRGASGPWLPPARQAGGQPPSFISAS